MHPQTKRLQIYGMLCTTLFLIIFEIQRSKKYWGRRWWPNSKHPKTNKEICKHLDVYLSKVNYL
jgi:ABC-type transport system involved in cytochrome c biogenesis permease subunit